MGSLGFSYFFCFGTKKVVDKHGERVYFGRKTILTERKRKWKKWKRVRRKRSVPAIHIGADKLSIRETGSLVLKIMKVDPKLSDSQVKVEALKTVAHTLETHHVSVSHCIIDC